MGGWLTDALGQVTGGLFDPRTEGQYAGIDRNNYNLPGYDQMRSRDEGLASGYAGRAAPQAADDPFWRQQQVGLGDRLTNLMNGNESMAQQQFGIANNAAMAQQRSLAASAAPGNAAMAQRMAMQNIGKLNQGLASNSAMLGIQERNAAAQAMGQLAGQARGQTMQGNQFNAGAQLQQTGLNDAAANAAYNRQLQGSMAQQQGGMAYEQNRSQRAANQLAQPTMGEQVLGAGMGAAMMAMGGPGAAAMASQSGALSSPGYTPGAFGTPMTLQTGAGAAPFIPSASPVGYTPGAYNVPMMLAKGGVATKPTNAIVGEAGPEAIIPLAQLPAILDAMNQGRTRIADSYMHRPTPMGMGDVPRPVVPPASTYGTNRYDMPALDRDAEMRRTAVLPVDPYAGYGRTKQTARKSR